MHTLQAEMTVAKNCFKIEEMIDQIMTLDKQLSHFKKHINITTFPNLFKLLNLALTIPISLASTMRRIKTYIISTMIQDRFLSLAIF